MLHFSTLRLLGTRRFCVVCVRLCDLVGGLKTLRRAQGSAVRGNVPVRMMLPGPGQLVSTLWSGCLLCETGVLGHGECHVQ